MIILIINEGANQNSTSATNSPRHVTSKRAKVSHWTPDSPRQKNPRSKDIAKLLLNSFWSRFRENLLKLTTEAVYNASHLFTLVSNPFNDTRQVRIANDNTVEVVYANLKDNQPDNGCVNIFS